ncbi:MAG: peptidase S9 [Candidatus Zixiibacteriota bacterium]|nr:MAG: peptidase S9 [candidate division Zixibacteria bacterium]
MKSSAVKLGLLVCLLAGTAQAQYFGRNKVQYESFDFAVIHTAHLDVYHYPRESEGAWEAARMGERWYYRLSDLLDYQMRETQPLILYANHADFQQTNVISGLISQGTGGVTEGMKQRIVLPLTGIHSENNHVIGHELVHGFQFDIMGRVGGGLGGGVQMPLWFIEGLAEYLTLGSRYPLTAMWLRDAVLNEEVPSIDDISGDPRYFPYRYGHALWAYIAAEWGDQAVPALFSSVAYLGWEDGFQNVLGISLDSLSARWQEAVRNTYQPEIENRTPPGEVGKAILTGGEGFNLGPVLSPDGQYVAFLSRRDIFTIDLYLAYAETGEVITRLVGSASDAHFDALSFMNAAGTWSPDGDRFAFVVFRKGDNEIALLDVDDRDVERRLKVDGVDAISMISWSPDGRYIAFSASSGGASDLYLWDVQADSARRLTEDRYSQVQPSWSPDGRTLAFATDRGGDTDLDLLQFGNMKIGLYDMDTQQIRLVYMDERTKHINPHFSPDGTRLYFIANPRGFSDVYYYAPAEDRFYQVTRIATGITGLSDLSPALSVSRQTGRLAFSLFNDTDYDIHTMTHEEAAGEPFDPEAEPVPADLPPPGGQTTEVDEYLASPALGLPSGEEFTVSDYNPSLGLNYVTQAGAGVAVDRFGASVGGGVLLLFGDMLGNYQLGVAVQSSGGLADIGGEAFYLNRNHRFNWGVGLGHIPYLTGSVSTSLDTVSVGGQPTLARETQLVLQRVFVDRASLLGEYPISTNRRWEFSGGYTRISYDYELETITSVGGFIIDQQTMELDQPSALNLGSASGAYVGDYSFFGFTSPVRGSRFRYELEGTFGDLNFLTALADYRRYFFFNPFTLAFRAMHLGRYLEDAESDRLTPLYLGFQTLVRGYEIGSFDLTECAQAGEDLTDCPQIDRLIGSRLGVGNLELRIPLFGTSQFGLINFPYLPTEIVGFLDGGVAWTNTEQPTWEFSQSSTARVPVFSSGAAARVNVLGALILQVYVAWPFQRPEKNTQWGFLISPGW